MQTHGAVTFCCRLLAQLEEGAGGDLLISIHETSGPGAGSWLNPPSASSHFFTDQAFVSDVRLRMHLPIFVGETQCQHATRPNPQRPSRRCALNNDRFGIHALHCQIGGGIVQRHNALRDLVAEKISDETGQPALVEQHNAAHSDNHEPDVSYQTWRGDTSWLDIEVVSPVARHSSQSRHTRAGSAIAAAESFKRRKYPALALVPIISAHLGRSRNDLGTFVRALFRSPDPATRTKQIGEFWQSWSSTLQQWNVKILSSAGRLLPP